jgi:hypothetical protein
VSHRPLGGAVDIPEVLTEHLVSLNNRRLKILSMRKASCIQSPLGGPFSPILGMGGGQNKGIDPMLQGTLRLLCGVSVEDALQPLVHRAHPVGGGCGQHVQKCGHQGHILVGLGEGGELPLHPFQCRGPSCLKRRFMLAQVGQPSLNNHLFVGEITSTSCGLSFNIVLCGTSSFLLVSRQLLGEGCWCSGPLCPHW